MIKYSLNKKEKSLLPSSLVANEPDLLTIMNIEEFKDNPNVKITSVTELTTNT